MKTGRIIKAMAVVTILFAGAATAHAGLFGHHRGGHNKEGREQQADHLMIPAFFRLSASLWVGSPVGSWGSVRVRRF